MRSLFRRGLRIGVVVGAILLLIQIFLRNPPPRRTGSQLPGRPQAPARRAERPSASPRPVPDDAAAGAPEAKAATAAPAWVDPEDGACPVTHPVKVKLASGIFHVPGGLAYRRTAPDRCYRDVAAAEADGFRPSKR